MLGKFQNLGLALSFSNNTKKMSAIILGNDNKYWVVTMAEMEQLLKAGYEVL